MGRMVVVERDMGLLEQMWDWEAVGLRAITCGHVALAVGEQRTLDRRTGRKAGFKSRAAWYPNEGITFANIHHVSLSRCFSRSGGI
jgi:hypothetical protein